VAIAVCGLLGAVAGQFFVVWEWSGLLSKLVLLACATWITLPVVRRAANSVKKDAALVEKSLISNVQ
jgi:multisubunit Na+/H+ antiporter MnhG subunit